MQFLRILLNPVRFGWRGFAFWGSRMNYRENEIAALSARIVAFVSEDNADVEIKVAALRAAAATIDAAISAQTQLVMLQNMLSGSRR